MGIGTSCPASPASPPWSLSRLQVGFTPISTLLGSRASPLLPATAPSPGDEMRKSPHRATTTILIPAASAALLKCPKTVPTALEPLASLENGKGKLDLFYRWGN